MDNETNQKGVIPLELSVHIEEYKELRREILQRVEFQQRFLNYTLLSIGLALGLISSGSAKCNEIAPWVVPWVVPLALLLFAFMFVCFSFWWSNQDMYLIWAVMYINTELRPKIENTIGGRQVLGWEDFLAQERAKLGKRYLLIPSLGLEFPLIVAALLIIGYWIYAHNSGIIPATMFLWLFWSFILVLWVIAVFIRVHTNLRYVNFRTLHRSLRGLG